MSANKLMDFDEQAKLLWAKLNLDPDSKSGGRWNPVDPIYKVSSYRHDETID
jgi:hypothetical protein